MERYLATVLVCIVLSCGSRSEVKGPVLVLRAASPPPGESASLTEAASHDADLIARRLQFVGYSQCTVRAQDSTIAVQSPTTIDSSQFAAVTSARGVLALYEVSGDTAAAAAVDSVAAYYDQPQSQQPLADFTRILQGGGVVNDYWVRPGDYDRLAELLYGASDAWPKGVGFAFGPVESYRGTAMRRVYVTGAEPVIFEPRVQRVDTAHVDSTQTRPRQFSAQFVTACLSDSDAERYSQLTARTVGQRLAIAVDSVVLSAPLIQAQNPDGRILIVMYDAPAAPARLLAAIISSGPLDVSWRVTGRQP